MMLGIYKAGQGYWVRVLTAIGAAICFGAAALWAWDQATLLPIPQPTTDLTLGQVDGTINVNDIAALQADGGAAFGSAVVKEVGDGQGNVIIGDITINNDEMAITQTTGLSFDSGLQVRVTGRRPIPLFEPLYLQAAVAGVIILLGAAVTFFYVGAHRKSVDFLIATDNEMKKVNWSTRKDVQGSTIVVIVAAFLITAGLFAVDLGFSWFFKTVGVLTS